MAYRVLDYDLMVELYRETIAESPTGQGSCQRVVDKLVARGVVIPWTGLPPSRQAVRQVLRRGEEGRKLLAEAAKTKWRKAAKSA